MRWVMPVDRRGAAAAEFVLVLPLFFLIIFATMDIVRVFRAQIRMEMIAVQIGQIVSQCTRITPEDFTHPTFGFWAHAARIAAGRVDVNSPTGGTIIISALGRDGNQNRLRWRSPPTGNATTQSIFGTTASPTPTLRGRNGDTFLVPDGQTLFATEVFAIVQPWILSPALIGTAQFAEIRGVTFFLSRASDPAQLQQPPTVPTPPTLPRSCTL